MSASIQIKTAQPLPPFSRVAFIVANAIFGWETRRTSRRSLSRLDRHILRDIGLTPEAAEAEFSKPFWRA